MTLTRPLAHPRSSQERKARKLRAKEERASKGAVALEEGGTRQCKICGKVRARPPRRRTTPREYGCEPPRRRRLQRREAALRRAHGGVGEAGGVTAIGSWPVAWCIGRRAECESAAPLEELLCGQRAMQLMLRREVARRAYVCHTHRHRHKHKHKHPGGTAWGAMRSNRRDAGGLVGRRARVYRSRPRAQTGASDGRWCSASTSGARGCRTRKSRTRAPSVRASSRASRESRGSRRTS